MNIAKYVDAVSVADRQTDSDANFHVTWRHGRTAVPHDIV